MQRALSLIVLALMLLSCSRSDRSFVASIAFSNMAVNYPLLVAVVPDQTRTRLLKLDLSTGTESWAIVDTYDLVGIGPSKAPGEFLLVGGDEKGDSILRYTAANDAVSVATKFNAKIRYPFESNGYLCGLSPKLITKKGEYNFSIICKDSEIEILSSKNIEIVEDFYSGDGKSLFSDVNVYSGRYDFFAVSVKDRVIAIDSFIITEKFSPIAFLYRDQIVYGARQARRPVRLKSVDGRALDVPSDGILQRIAETASEDIQKVLYVDEDKVVYSTLRFGKGEVIVHEKRRQSSEDRAFQHRFE